MNLATLFPLKSLFRDFSTLLKQKEVTDIQCSGCKLHELRNFISGVSKQNYLVQGKNKNCQLPRTSLLLDFESLNNNFEGVYLHKRDNSRIGTDIDCLIQGKYDSGRTFFASLFFDNYEDYYIENFLASTAVEQIFSTWFPKYAWLEVDHVIYDPEIERPYIFQQSMLDTPWQHYSHTMIFGPELVEKLDLKKLDWQHKDIFFSKWVTENLLWLASPWGIRSEVKRFENEDEAEEVTKKHYLALKERLNLHPLRSLETKEWKVQHPFVSPLGN